MIIGPVPLWLLLVVVAGVAGTQEDLAFPVQHPFMLVLGAFLVVRVLFQERNTDWVDLLVWTVAFPLTLVVLAPLVATFIGVMPVSTATHFAQPALTVFLLGVCVEIGYLVFGELVSRLTDNKTPVQRTVQSST